MTFYFHHPTGLSPGKSQVLVNTAVAAIHRGERVLIASKNNKAVDVVQARLEGLHPVVRLPKVGKKSIRGEVARAMLHALDTTPTSRPRQLSEDWERVAAGMKPAIAALKERDQHQLAAQRLQRQIDDERSQLAPALRSHRLSEDPTLIRASLDGATAAHELAEKVPGRWWWQRRRAVKSRAEAAAALRSTIALLDLPHALSLPTANRFNETAATIERLLRIEEAQRVMQEHLDTLDVLPSDAELHAQLAEIEDRQEVSVALTAATLARARRPGTPAASAARDLFSTLQTVATSGRGTRALPPKVPDALQAFPLWVATTMAASSMLPLAPGLFDLVILDEAGQADFVSAVPLLMRARRAMVVGDPHQLPHITQISDGHDEILARRAGLSEAEHASFSYVAKSLYGVAAGRSAAQPLALVDHYRSHPDIIGISNRAFYGDQLRVRTTRPSTGPTPVEWIDVKGQWERGLAGKSALNRQEANAVVRLVSDLRGDGRSVGIVSPFRAQVDLIKKMLGQDAADVAVGTAHGFQGDERDVVIISFVVNNEASDFMWGYAGNPNLVNVAITRARDVLRIVGDRDACRRSATILNEIASMDLGTPE